MGSIEIFFVETVVLAQLTFTNSSKSAEPKKWKELFTDEIPLTVPQIEFQIGPELSSFSQWVFLFMPKKSLSMCPYKAYLVKLGKFAQFEQIWYDDLAWLGQPSNGHEQTYFLGKNYSSTHY